MFCCYLGIRTYFVYDGTIDVYKWICSFVLIFETNDRTQCNVHDINKSIEFGTILQLDFVTWYFI